MEVTEAMAAVVVEAMTGGAEVTVVVAEEEAAAMAVPESSGTPATSSVTWFGASTLFQYSRRTSTPPPRLSSTGICMVSYKKVVELLRRGT